VANSDEAIISYEKLVEIPCTQSGFALWKPIHDFGETTLGLYSDSRFPGRVILALNRHIESIDELNPSELAGFVSVIQLCVTAMRLVTSCDRVNIAILGNREPHLHAHLIPRLKSDPMPKDAPWLDSRPKQPLDREREEAIVAAYITTLKHLEH
jgi:diadenosine tetraphosphate (Ap4A) HIT family hydrolase